MATSALVWLRRDLRLYDHAALAEATASFDDVYVAFVFDTTILNALPDTADRRVDFIYRSLQEVDTGLRRNYGSLICLHGNPIQEVPALAQRLAVSAVVTARDYEPYARDRDAKVASALELEDIEFRTVQDTVGIEPGTLMSGSGTPFRVYTPFSKAWKAAFHVERDAAELQPDLTRVRKGDQDLPSLESLGFQSTDLWLEPGEAGGRARLASFAERIAKYRERRDFPADDATSGLSVHFRFGTVSIREAIRMAYAAGPDGEKWLNELIWREFYQDILWNVPSVVEHPFQPQYEGLDWPGEEKHWVAWCEGMTGYPIVDAAMRCLNATGWMHNRLRMVAASFLTKDLLIDYRRGEQYFADKLLDFELASNNGGWQWSASVGADAQPYFRIFNPYLQSVKFDPKGEFIRQWVPELAELDDRAIHDPSSLTEMERLASGVELGVTYPKPIVDHAVQKAKAIALLSHPPKA